MARRGARTEPRASLSMTAMTAMTAILTASACVAPVAPVVKPTPKKPLCAIESTVATERPPRDRQFPPSHWFTLLLSGYQSSGVLARPASDCSGRLVTVASEACGNETGLQQVPIERLTEKELLVADVGETTRLAWAMIDRLADGEVQGPVGLVEITQRGLVVRALGVLRGYPERATLRMTTLGTGTVLVAEGERCGERDPADGCARAMRFLFQSGERFLPMSISDAGGACLGPAFVALTGRGTDKASSDRYRLETSVSFGPSEVTLREQLTIVAARGGGDFVRQVRSDRRLSLRDGRLVASGPALLSRWQTQSDRGSR